MIPQFPQELYDLFIDNVADDKQSLHACATVSKAWSQSTRRHIFAKIVLVCTPAANYSWRQRYVDGDGLVPLQVYNCDQLYTFFTNCPYVIPYVHELKLTLSTFDFWVHHSIDEHQVSGVRRLLNTLTSIRKLEFCPAVKDINAMFWTTFPPSLLGAFSNVFSLQSLDTIYLHKWFVSPHDLLALLSQCPNVKKLQLRDISFHWTGNEADRDPPDSLCIPRLETLSLEQVSFKGMGTDDWVRIAAAEVRELTIRRSFYDSVQEHVDMLAGGLETLNLDIATDSEFAQCLQCARD
jgi:hypothetical protein